MTYDWTNVPDWTGAACKAPGVEVNFFPGRGDEADEAKAICAGCEMRDRCLDYALGDRSLVGIWGGTSQRERARIRRDNPRPKKVRLAIKPCGTNAAFKRHQRNGETPCLACKTAHAKYVANRKADRREMAA